MKHASYIGTRPGLMGLGNALIRLRLRGNASHCETVFEPGDGVDHLMPDGTCEPDSDGRLWAFSSVGLERLPEYSPRRAGKIGGARFKRINFADQSKWETVPVQAQPLLAARTAVDMQGERYDWLHILSFIAWPIKQDADRSTCAETCARLLGLYQPHRFDPCSLHEIVRAWIINNQPTKG